MRKAKAADKIGNGYGNATGAATEFADVTAKEPRTPNAQESAEGGEGHGMGNHGSNKASSKGTDSSDGTDNCTGSNGNGDSNDKTDKDNVGSSKASSKGANSGGTANGGTGSSGTGSDGTGGGNGDGGGRITGDLNWDGLGRPKIYYAMASIWCGIFLSVVDGNICNVALPTIAQELGVSSADSIWVVNSFQLVIMMTLLSFSSLGELFSYKRVYVSGVVLFTAGSLFCSLSHTLPLLIASRAFQGVGAAMIMSVNTTLVKIIYPKKYLGKGVGLNATVVALAAVTGPTIAAGILSFASWPWLFAINIPIGIVTFFMALRHLPDNPTHVLGRHFNIKDALLNAAVFGLLIGCIEMYSHGARPVIVIGGVVLLAVLGYIYVRSQLGRRYPMLPFDLLRIPVFSMSVVTSIISFTAQMMALIAIPFMLLHTFGMNAVETGLLMTSWPLIIMFVAPVAGSLIGKVHPGILGCFGMLLMSAGCFLLSYIPEDASHFDIVWRLMMCGAGFGFFQSPNNHMLLSSAPNHRAGSAGGMLATARLTGQSTGAALVALLFHIFGNSAPHDAMLLAGILTICSAVSSVSRLSVRNAKSPASNGGSSSSTA